MVAQAQALQLTRLLCGLVFRPGGHLRLAGGDMVSFPFGKRGPHAFFQRSRSRWVYQRSSDQRAPATSGHCAGAL